MNDLLLQDLNRGLSLWLATRLDAWWLLRQPLEKA